MKFQETAIVKLGELYRDLKYVCSIAFFSIHSDNKFCGHLVMRKASLRLWTFPERTCPTLLKQKLPNSVRFPLIRTKDIALTDLYTCSSNPPELLQLHSG